MEDEIKKIRVFIADDHPVFRAGLKLILENDAKIEFVGEAENGREAIKIIEEKQPDVALLDVDMPEKSGVEVAKLFKSTECNTEFAFLTMFKDKDLFDEVMEIGAKGYVLKDNAISEISNCITSIAKGEFYISPTVSNFILQRSKAINDLQKKNPVIEKLSPCEITILKSVGEYRTSKEIAADLNLSVRTIEHYRANIADKLNLRGKRALLEFVLEHKTIL